MLSYSPVPDNAYRSNGGPQNYPLETPMEGDSYSVQILTCVPTKSLSACWFSLGTHIVFIVMLHCVLQSGKFFGQSLLIKCLS